MSQPTPRPTEQIGYAIYSNEEVHPVTGEPHKQVAQAWDQADAREKLMRFAGPGAVEDDFLMKATNGDRVYIVRRRITTKTDAAANG